LLKGSTRRPIPQLPDRNPGSPLQKRRGANPPEVIIMRKLIPGVGPLLAAVVAMVPVVGPILAGILA